MSNDSGVVCTHHTYLRLSQFPGAEVCYAATVRDLADKGALSRRGNVVDRWTWILTGGTFTRSGREVLAKETLVGLLRYRTKTPKERWGAGSGGRGPVAVGRTRTWQIQERIVTARLSNRSEFNVNLFYQHRCRCGQSLFHQNEEPECEPRNMLYDPSILILAL